MGTYAIEMADGSVGIMQTVDGVSAEDCLAKWHPDSQKKVVSQQEIDPAGIPADRTFRNAWVLIGKMIEHDMDKARDILRDRLRVERAPRFAALDIEYQRADEVGDPVVKARIAAQKQALRDATDDPRIDAAGTAAELKLLTLDVVTNSLTDVSEIVKD